VTWYSPLCSDKIGLWFYIKIMNRGRDMEKAADGSSGALCIAVDPRKTRIVSIKGWLPTLRQ